LYFLFFRTIVRIPDECGKELEEDGHHGDGIAFCHGYPKYISEAPV
jgi:hypothetical protein